MQSIPYETVIDYLKDQDEILTNLLSIAQLAPDLDEADLETKARLGVQLLYLVHEYAEDLAALSDGFSDALDEDRALD